MRVVGRGCVGITGISQKGGVYLTFEHRDLPNKGIKGSQC